MSDFISLLSEQRNFLWQLLVQHILLSSVAILLATIIGIGIGILIDQHQKIAKPVMALVNALYTVPSIALLGILISITGIGNTTAIIALTIYGLMPMIHGTYTGLSNVDPLLTDAATGMGATDRQLLVKVKLPLAFPVIFSSFRTLVTMTIAMAAISSYVGAGGLGVAIYRGISTNNSKLTLAGSLLVALFAMIVDFILSKLALIIERKSIKRPKKSRVLILVTAVCLIATGLLLPRKQASINIATKPQPENYILGYMQKAVIEKYTKLKVNMTEGVGGGTANINPGMRSGKFDLYGEYTGTVWEVILKQSSAYDESKFSELAKKYQAQDQLEFVNKFGFNNTFGIAIRRDLARKYNIKTYSDLAKYAGKLTLGAEADFFGRKDGYQKLQKTYGMTFNKTVDMDSGLKYSAIASKKVDVINVFTTDAQIATAKIVVLKDDRKMYPSYQAGTVIRTKTLQKYPELKTALGKLDNILTDEQMAKLNSEVVINKKEPRSVALNFLRKRGII